MAWSPAVPTASSPWSARELQRWHQWPPPWLYTKPHHLNHQSLSSGVHLTMSVCLSHTVSLVSGPLPLTTGIKTKYKRLNEEEMPYNSHLSSLPLLQISPSSSYFQNAHIKNWQPRCYKHVCKKEMGGEASLQLLMVKIWIWSHKDWRWITHSTKHQLHI